MKLTADKCCNWCGDRGLVLSLTHWDEGKHRELGDQPYYHSGCFTAMKEAEARANARRQRPAK